MEKPIKQPVVRPQLNITTLSIVLFCLNKQIKEFKKNKVNKTHPTEYKQILRVYKLLKRDYVKLKAAIQENKKRRVDKPKPKPAPKVKRPEIKAADRALLEAYNMLH